MKRALVLCLLLGGCATQVAAPDAPKVVTVNVPVPVSCVAPDFPPAPPAFSDSPDARKAAQTFAQDYDLLDKAWQAHIDWETALWDQIEACRMAPAENQANWAYCRGPAFACIADPVESIAEAPRCSASLVRLRSAVQSCPAAPSIPVGTRVFR